MHRFIALLLLTVTAPAWGGTALTSDSAARYALEKNHTLKAARLALAAADAKARGAGRLSNPAFEATVAGGAEWEGRVELGLMQRFPLTARLRLEKEISALEIEAARCEIEDQERIITAKVREAFVTLARNREAVALRQRQVELNTSFADSLNRRVSEGFASPLDAGEGALEAKHLQASLKALEAEEAAAASELATLLALPSARAIEVQTPLALPKAPPTAKSTSDRPDVRLARIAIEAAEKDIGLARAMRWEDIGVGLFIEGERTRDEPEGIDTEGLIGMKLSVPLPVWNTGASAVQERRIIAQRRMEMLEALRLSVTHEVESASLQMRARFAAARQLQGDVLPAARKLLTDTQASYDRGETEFQRLFRLRERLTNLETASLEAVAEYHLARIRWEAALGLTQP